MIALSSVSYHIHSASNLGFGLLSIVTLLVIVFLVGRRVHLPAPSWLLTASRTELLGAYGKQLTQQIRWTLWRTPAILPLILFGWWLVWRRSQHLAPYALAFDVIAILVLAFLDRRRFSHLSRELQALEATQK